MRTIELFFDLSSPYSYLAATQLPAIAATAGAALVWRPIALGAVFKATGNSMPVEVPAKARWMMTDLQAWAAQYGVPFQLNEKFPLNTIPAMRLVLVGAQHGRAEQVALEAFRRMWGENRDITAPDELRAIAAAGGLPEGAEAHITDPAIKDALKANTDEAIARGVFGAPAMFVGDRLFWGNDRLAFVEQELAR